MEFQEFLEDLNNYCEANIYYCFDTLIEDYIEPQGVVVTYLQTIYSDEHNWYTMNFNVYRVVINEQDYYMGVAEVDVINSNIMAEEDCCGVKLGPFVEMEPYTIISYRKKKN